MFVVQNKSIASAWAIARLFALKSDYIRKPNKFSESFRFERHCKKFTQSRSHGNEIVMFSSNLRCFYFKFSNSIAIYMLCERTIWLICVVVIIIIAIIFIIEKFLPIHQQNGMGKDFKKKEQTNGETKKNRVKEQSTFWVTWIKSLRMQSFLFPWFNYYHRLVVSAKRAASYAHIFGEWFWWSMPYINDIEKQIQKKKKNFSFHQKRITI